MQPQQQSNKDNNNNNIDFEKFALSTAEIDGLVYGYLKSRGHHRVLAQLRALSKSRIEFVRRSKLTSEALHIMTDKIQTMLHSIYGYTHSDNNIEWFDDQYRYLYLWINNV